MNDYAYKGGGNGAPAINNDTISRGEEAGDGGAPAINNDTISRGEEAGSGGAPAINNDTASRGDRADDSNYYQQKIKLQNDFIKELKRMLYEQQQLQSRDEKNVS